MADGWVQAGRARNYQEYAARLKELRSAYVMQEYDGLHKKMVGVNDQLADVVDQLAAVRREIESRRTRQAELQMELEGAQEASRRAERDLLAAQNEQATVRQRGDFARQQILQLSEQRELLSQRHGDLGERLAARQADVTRHEEELAAAVVFLVQGGDKAPALKSVLEGPVEPEQLPAQLIRPARGSLLWLVDRDAAARLSPTRTTSG